MIVNTEAVFLVMLGTSSFPSVVFPYTSCPAGNKLVPSMTKNTPSEFAYKKFKKIVKIMQRDLHSFGSKIKFLYAKVIHARLKGLTQRH